MKILVINGPNLNFLGIREKDLYGTKDYDFLQERIKDKAADLEMDVEIFQSNSEGAIIDRIQLAYLENLNGIIINPGALSHTSVSLHDALTSVTTMPKIEVHITNIHAREEFRQRSVTAPACDGQICGLGINGYLYALEAVKDILLLS
ncbi:MAG: type II 3-dehydroquinate dehydratase [Clostridiales bacterium]|nr:type II 3-dehydroquinate dehydratase [Clostridiales bacterium]MBS5877195.1 type II 3-dehydroquinate dehydratase [Clostridiales bacterium]MDU0938964.1 type II 3-dehydroquinate dehydratase [Clostridiales bacterium]MDU1041901.1 type II 3-dehydroquinate dehydratase [Clostridiales bacterium]MDU3490845.1 type II 3-dehydroquinate dehydratase [Clostridiales bacterium]